MTEVHQWADETFGQNRSASSVAHHLVQESNELSEALELFKEYPTDKNKIKVHKEFADAFILILNAASKHGLTLENLLTFAQHKMDQNRERIWGEPDEKGVVNHVKEIRGMATARYIELHGRALAIEHSKAEQIAPKVEVIEGAPAITPPANLNPAKTHAEAIDRMYRRGANVRAYDNLLGINGIKMGGAVVMGVDAEAFADLLQGMNIGGKKFKCVLYVLDAEQYQKCIEK